MNKDTIKERDVITDLKTLFSKYGVVSTSVAFIAQALEIDITEADKRWDDWMDDSYYTSLFNPIIAGESLGDDNENI
jgi:hypothetical protein